MASRRGTTVLVSGTAGSGKTSLAAHFANATCERGERCLYLAFEESPSQLVRNMRSVAVDLGRWVDDERLRIHASRPTAHGLEMHLAGIHKLVRDFQPQVVILDPITSLVHAGAASAASATLLRVVDFLKSEGITALFTSLTSGGDDLEQTEVGVSSLVDTWLLLRSIELNGERNRGLYVLKSRGMAHSNQIREFMLGEHGVELVDVYVGAGGVLTGSSRLVQAAREEAEQRSREWELERKRRDMTRKRRALEARIAALEAEFEAEFEEMERAVAQDQAVVLRLQQDRAEMARSRSADVGMARSGASDVAVQGNGSPE